MIGNKFNTELLHIWQKSAHYLWYAVIGVAALSVLGGQTGWYHRGRLRREVQLLNSKMRELDAAHTQIQHEITLLKDNATLEKIAREEYMYGKPGEIIFRSNR